MIHLSHRQRFLFISIITISFLWIVLSVEIKGRMINTFSVKRTMKTRSRLFNYTDIFKNLSSYLIHNRIYPRRTNLTNITYSNDSLPYNNVSCPLFITMADTFYLPAVRNFQSQLRNYGLQENLVVLCLDDECVKLCKSKDIFAWWGFVHTSVARIKVVIHCCL
jgi:hypothetical protein